MNMANVGIVSRSLKIRAMLCKPITAGLSAITFYTLCANLDGRTRYSSRYSFAFYIRSILGRTLSDLKKTVQYGSYVIPVQTAMGGTHFQPIKLTSSHISHGLQRFSSSKITVPSFHNGFNGFASLFLGGCDHV